LTRLEHEPAVCSREPEEVAVVPQTIDPQRPQLLFFYSSTSGSSRRAEGFLAQVLQRRHNHDSFYVRRIEATQHPQLVGRFKVDVLPTLIVLEDKRIRARIATPRGCAEISRTLAPWLNV
jgi:thioredoxin-like negative regulator of GroEL